MPDRCDKCGILALESKSFAEERIPFRRAKHYCPACHQKFYERVYLVSFLVVLFLATIEIANVLRGHREVTTFSGMWWLLICLIQWLMIVPHELGHAIAGKLLGFTQIRIMIGAGKPFLSFDLAGFYWIINPIPFGGLTYSASPGKLHRWKHLVFVGGGLSVNLIIGGIAWCFIGAGGLFGPSGGLAKLIFWANLLIVAQNLIPWVVRTSIGSIPNDGLQIWQILFRWNKPPKNPSTTIPFWEVLICHVLKWLIFAVVVIVTLFLGFAVLIPFARPFAGMAPMGIAGKLLWLAIFLPLTALCGWYCWRVYREPVAKMRRPAATPEQPVNFRSLLNEEQFEMLQHASKLLKGKFYPEAVMLLERLLPVIADQNSEGYRQLLKAKVQCLFSLQRGDEAEALSLDYARRDVSREQKLKLLDEVASFILYQDSSAFLKHAERLARVCLEIAPGTLTLKGTLGALLAEQGNYSEAEPLLADCLERSPALHDRGIATFYLGMIKLHAGEAKDGKRLVKRGMNMYPEIWIVAKGQQLLKDVRATGKT
jgi:hypothetical protein